MTSVSVLHSECLRLLDSEAHLKCVYGCVMSLPAQDYIHSVAAIAHSLLIRQKLALHKVRYVADRLEKCLTLVKNVEKTSCYHH